VFCLISKSLRRTNLTELSPRAPRTGVGQLWSILRDKGLITAAEAASLHVSSAPSTSVPLAAEPVKTAPVLAAGQSEKPADPGSDPPRKVKFYGTLLFNAYFGDQSSNNIDCLQTRRRRSLKRILARLRARRDYRGRGQGRRHSVPDKSDQGRVVDSHGAGLKRRRSGGQERSWPILRRPR